MYERFSERARQVMQLANLEAQRVNRENIDTEHLLIGLLLAPSSVATTVLANMGVDLAIVCRDLEGIIPSGPGIAPRGKLPYSMQARKVIQYAMDECIRIKGEGPASDVSTEHILLGLLREQEGVAAQVLMNLGVNLDDSRRKIVELLGPPPINRLGGNPLNPS